MVLVLEFLVAASFTACLLQLACAWRTLGRAAPGPAGDFAPPVSILKPLKGVDDRLYDALAAFCRLDYPEYEVVFCLQSASDPALRVARKVKERFPGRAISIVVESCRDGLNPKVNNMIPGYRKSRYPFVLISDSNVSVGPGYLREAVSHFRDPGVGLVTHLVRGVGGKSAGARLENGHLNTFILGSVSMLDRLFGMPCVVGKSIMMRKGDLETLGGLHAVKDFLAEDYTLGAMVRRAGMRVVVSGAPVDTVNVYRGVRDFLSRHARWNRMRFSIAGPAYLFEILANPFLLSLALVAATGGSSEALLAAGGVALGKLAVDASMNRLLRARIGVQGVLLGPVRDLLAAGLWLSAFFSRTVTWRGRSLRITRGSLLVPVDEEAVPKEAVA
ncbi:MAG: glycosyltransferase [Deltaproteobacteria bacterium]|nr:glycosyltransferase [Deltaproteobacteria bacterium]